MLKIGESLTFANDPAKFTDIYTDIGFTLDKYSKKTVLLSFVEFNNGWGWLKHLVNIRSAVCLEDDLQIIAVIFQSTPGLLSDQLIIDKIHSDPELNNLDFKNLPGLVIAKDLPDTSDLNSRYAGIYANYIINDGPYFDFKSPGYVCYSYISCNDMICDKWHTNCTAYEIHGDIVEGSPVIQLCNAVKLNIGDSISGNGLPAISTVNTVDSDFVITLDKIANETLNGVKLTIGSGDPLSFNRIIIKNEPLFNSRDFCSNEKYILKRLEYLKSAPVILGSMPESGKMLNSLKDVEIYYSKPLTKTVSDKTKYILSGDGVGNLVLGDVLNDGAGRIENSIILKFGGSVDMGNVVISVDDSVVDNDGNPIMESNSVNYKFDIIAPEIISFVNNTGSPTSNDSIKFTLTASDNIRVTHWGVNESETPPVPDSPLWISNNNDSPELIINSTINLSAGDGLKQIYAWVKDEADNINSISDNSWFSLKYDPRVPAITSFVPKIPRPTNEKRIFFDLSGLDNFKVTGWMITESIEKPSADAHEWSEEIPLYYDLKVKKSKLAGLYAWAKDGEGNVSSACTDSHFDVIYDIDPPEIIEFTAELNGPTSSKDIIIKTVVGVDINGIAGWMITQTNKKPDVSDEGWSDSKPRLFKINADSSSTIRIYAWAKDQAGNVSDVNENSHVNILYDIDPPVITEFRPGINENSDKNEFTIGSLKGSDNTGIASWMITQARTKPEASSEEWTKTKPVKFTVNANRDSVITLYAWAKDKAGNVSDLSDKSHFRIKYVAPRPSIKINCVSKGVVLLNGDTVSFDDTLTDRNTLLLFSIENKGGAKLNISGITLKGLKFFTITPVSDSMTFIEPKGDPLTFGIKFNPVSMKSYNSSLIIKSNDPDADSFTIQLKGRGVPAISVTALTDNKGSNYKTDIYHNDLFDMGVTTTAKNSKLDLHITNNGITNIAISAIIFKSGSSTAFGIVSLPQLPSKLIPGESMLARILFSPGMNNKYYKALLNIKSNDELCENFNLSLIGASSVQTEPTPSVIKKNIPLKKSPVKRKTGIVTDKQRKTKAGLKREKDKILAKAVKILKGTVPKQVKKVTVPKKIEKSKSVIIEKTIKKTLPAKKPLKETSGEKISKSTNKKTKVTIEKKSKSGTNKVKTKTSKREVEKPVKKVADNKLKKDNPKIEVKKAANIKKSNLR